VASDHQRCERGDETKDPERNRFWFRRPGGYLARQGRETLRWALYEAAKNPSHQRSPDHAYYARLKDRHGGKIAAISIARLFTRRCYHILRNLNSDVVYFMPT
jgi:hypothetical protein